MFKTIKKEIEWNGSILKLEYGKIARQADASVVITLGGTVVLCTVTTSKQNVSDIDFVALSVNYMERYYAAGRFPGGFVKRETKASDKETLIARLIDRSIRPLFATEYNKEIQVTCTVLSYDSNYKPDIISIIGVSSALICAGLPIDFPVAAVRVTMDSKDHFSITSSDYSQNSHDKRNRDNSNNVSKKLDLVIAGTEGAIIMVEAAADELTDDKMIEALTFGHSEIKKIIEFINSFALEILDKKRKKKEVAEIKTLKERVNRIKRRMKGIQSYKQKIKNIYKEKSKILRYESIKSLEEEAIKDFCGGVLDNSAEDRNNLEYNPLEVKKALADYRSEYIRTSIIKTGKRIDGREVKEIRNIECELDLLPRTHGSTLFTRGETQVLSVMTLGNDYDEQMNDTIDGASYDRLTLHYNFPPYSVGEVGILKAPGRREIGHGKLACKAVMPVMPTKESFPYAIRIVAEVTESNGSSSMAAVCGTSLLAMSSGIPIKSHVAGIAMGLIKEKKDVVILSDIMGDEDHLGDMDFKIASTRKGITALQMDLKTDGIDIDLMKEAIIQAKEGINTILNKLEETISKPRTNTNKYAPKAKKIKINKDKIKDIIGPGGKKIRELSEKYSAKITVDDSGYIMISSANKQMLDKVISTINEISCDPEVGSVYEGYVSKVTDFGLFVCLFDQVEGLVHVSDIFDQHVSDISQYFKEGDSVRVKIIAINKGSKGNKIKLTMKGMRNDIPSLPSNNDKSSNKTRYF